MRVKMKGSKVSVRLRGHSDEQAQTTTALLWILLLHKIKEKEKVTACANTQTLHTLSPFSRSTFIRHL